MVDDEWYCSDSLMLLRCIWNPLNIYSEPAHRLEIKLGYKIYNEFFSDPESTNKYYDIMSDMSMSVTWSSASDQFKYFSDPNNGYINGDVTCVVTEEDLKRVSGVQVGDLIYWDKYEDDGNLDERIDHATIVSYVDENGNIYYAGNSEQRFEYKLSDGLSYGTAYIVRLNDCIFD